jgi:hypothetical protein
MNRAAQQRRELNRMICFPGLPDVSWYNIPKRGEYTKYHKIYQNYDSLYKMTIKYTLCHKIHISKFSTPRPSKIYLNWNLGFEKICTIWQPWTKWNDLFPIIIVWLWEEGISVLCRPEEYCLN